MKFFVIIVFLVLLPAVTVAQGELAVPTWSFGAEKGYSLLDGEVRSGNGFAFGFQVTRHMNRWLAWQVHLGMGDLQGLDRTPTAGWLDHPGWNGTINEFIDYRNAVVDGDAAVFANYQSQYLEGSIQGIINLTQLPFISSSSRFNVHLLFGLGGMRYKTAIDAADADGFMYDFSQLDLNEPIDFQLANLTNLLDGNYETEINPQARFTPLYQFGAGINWSIADNISLALTHRISLTGTDEIDSYRWNTDNSLNPANDQHHLTSIGICYTLFKNRTPSRPPYIALIPLPTFPLTGLNVPPVDPRLPAFEIVIPMIEPTEPEVVELTEKEAEVVRRAFDNLEFETNRAVIRSVSFASLNELAALLSEHPNWKLRITGHTDDVGTEAANLILSQRRAESCRDYLAQRGIDPERFLVFWYGESQPIADNTSPEGRQRNRRVEMEIVE